MIALSLNEVETIAAKVGRGAGQPWGLAEELSRAARRLAEGGLPWAGALAAFAENSSSWRAPGADALALWREGRGAPKSEGALCPLRLGALLIDDPSILRERPLRVERVGLPLWLAAMLAPERGQFGFRIDWPGAAIDALTFGLAPAAEDGDWLARQATVTIAPLTDERRAIPRLSRAEIEPSTLAVLSAVAERIYVPASAASRVRGAGGGGVDDD